MDKHFNYIEKVKEWHGGNQTSPPLAMLRIYGCQQNLADGDRLRGMLTGMGYGLTDDRSMADLLVINTCAVRETAEQRAFGHLGGYLKVGKPGQKIVMCGCMAQRPEVREKLRKSYGQVSLSFGPADLTRFPEYLYSLITSGKRDIHESPDTAPISEDIPVLREGPPRAHVTIMTGCNNFCSYCVVPYVRGRERSREPEKIIAEVKGLIADGYSEIWLLGQNVNSYRPENAGIRFPALLRILSSLDGDFHLRFMTSHPRDAGEELFRAIAESKRVAPFLHLPVQAGSDRILAAMNRGYTREEYLDKVKMLRQILPDINLTSDIIVGFPGETEEDFEDTLSLLREARFNSLFTFIYSAREGTPAAEMRQNASPDELSARFARLLETQREIEGKFSNRGGE